MIKKFKLVSYIDPGQIHLPDSTDLYSASDYFLEPLEDNISKNGIITPLIIRDDEAGRRELVCGKRRLICARLLRMKTVPCIKIKCTKQQSALFRLSERLCTSGENYFETADSLSDLITNHSLTPAKIADSLGVSAGEIKEKLKLLDFPFELRQKAAEHLTESQVMSLMMLPNNKLSAAIDEVVENNFNEKQTQNFVNSFYSPQKKEPVRKAAISDLRFFSNSIEKLLSTIQNAGYDTEFSMSDEDRYIDFRIRVRKKADMLDLTKVKTG